MEGSCFQVIFGKYASKLIFLWTLLLLGGCSGFREFALKHEQQVYEIFENQQVTDIEPLKSPLLSEVSEKESYDHALDLYELLDRAFSHNPLTKIAWHQATLVSAQKTKVDSAFYPHVSANLTVVRAEQTGSMSSDGKHLTSQISNVLSPQIEINYSLFKFGAHKELSQSALSALKAANFQFSQALQDVAYAVESAYFALDSAQAIVRANEQNLEDAKVALDVAKNRHQSGLTNKQDLLKAQAAYSAAVFDLENSRSSVEVARAQLAQAMGIQVHDHLRIVASNEKAIPDMDNMEQLIGEALRKRYDMQAERETLEAKKHQLNAKNYDCYPEVFTRLSASRKKIENIGGMYNNFEAAIGLKWDIFDGHLKASEQLMAYEEMKIAHQRLNLKELDIRSQVWKYFYTLKSAIHKLDAAKEAENFALEAFNYTKEAYANGLSSFTDLSTSQNALSSARKQFVGAKNDLAMGWVQLAYVTGKILEK
ncbi:MAG: TolC family protein [Puniceicoccales bacterium]|nr:TolC family protein [Puniceicoccales bacterium]